MLRVYYIANVSDLLKKIKNYAFNYSTIVDPNTCTQF